MSTNYHLNLCIRATESNPALVSTRDNIELFITLIRVFLEEEVDEILACNISIVESSESKTIYYCLHDNKVFEDEVGIEAHRNIIIEHFKKHVFDLM